MGKNIRVLGFSGMESLTTKITQATKYMRACPFCQACIRG